MHSVSNICILYQIYAFYTRAWLKMADHIPRRDLIQDALEHISRFDISGKTWKLFRIPTIILVFYPPSVRFYNVNWQGFKNTIRILSFKVHINPPQFLVVCTEDAKRAGKLLYSFWFSPLVPEIFASKKPNFGLSARNCRECFQRFRAWEPGTIRFHTTRNT